MVEVPVVRGTHVFRMCCFPYTMLGAEDTGQIPGGGESPETQKDARPCFKKTKQAGCQWLMSVILATWEAETRRILV
jgi:hypothetical protein